MATVLLNFPSSGHLSTWVDKFVLCNEKKRTGDLFRTDRYFEGVVCIHAVVGSLVASDAL